MAIFIPENNREQEETPPTTGRQRRFLSVGNSGVEVGREEQGYPKRHTKGPTLLQ